MFTVTRLALLAVFAGGISAAALEKRSCPHDNLLRCLIGTPALAAPFCSASAGVVVQTPTVYVASTPTVFATSSTSTTATLETTETTSTTTTTSTITTTSTTATDLTTTTALSTDTFLTTSTAITSTTTSSIRTITQTVIILNKRDESDGPAVEYRAAPKTSLGCIADLKPSAAAIASACSCFSGSYTAPAVTVTTPAEPTTVYLGTDTVVSLTTHTDTDTAILTNTAISTAVDTSTTSETVTSSSTETVTVPATITSTNIQTVARTTIVRTYISWN